MGNSPRDCGTGGQWLGFIFSGGELSSWGVVLEPVLTTNAAVTPSQKTIAKWSGTRLSHGSYGIYVAITGCSWL